MRRRRAPLLAVTLAAGLALVAPACGDDPGSAGSTSVAVGVGASSSSAPSSSVPSSTAPSSTAPTSVPTTGRPTATVLMRPGVFGGVEVGSEVSEALATGLLGEIGAGCEAAGPGAQSAPLAAPYEGSVSVDDGVVSTITVVSENTGFARPGSSEVLVRNGDDLAAATAALEGAGFTRAPDDGTGEMFGVTIAQFTEFGEPVVALVADPESSVVTSLSTPSPAICE